MRYDYCKGCRKTYNAALELLASNNWIVGAMTGMPLYYLAAMMIVYHKSYFVAYLSGGAYSFLSILIAAWINASICLWRIWPNGLTLSIFVMKAFGYWSFVSFFILLFYGVSRLPVEIATYLIVLIMPEILLLLFTADVLRAARTRHFKALEATSTLAAPRASSDDVEAAV
jgi:hypothetical protein